MSVKVIHEEIERFIKSDEPEVLCISGRWGVGKTYAWNKFINDLSDQSKLENYSYVSLFGLNSLEDLKFSIFENTIPLKSKIVTKNPTLDQRIDWLNKHYKKAFSFIARNPIFRSKLGTSEKILFLGVRKQLVCIDDLERSGEGLRILDVLGTASFLKEERGCKVVLLLNDEELSKNDQEIFTKQLEKVSDVMIKFEPTPEESSELVFAGSDEVSQKLKDLSIKLGVTNIRILKKVERTVKRLKEILVDYPGLQEQIMHSVTLFEWANNKGVGAPSTQYLENFNSAVASLKKDEDLSENEISWRDLLRSYNFLYLDDFDKAVLQGVQNGYFDKDLMIEEAEKLKAQGDLSQKEQAVSAAWDMYHDSFNVNDEDVLNTIYQVSFDNCEAITPMNLSSTIEFLKEFSKTAEAKNLLEHYVEVRSEEKEIFDLDHYSFRGDVKDKDVVVAFRNKFKTFEDKRDPVQLLLSIAKHSGWNQEDLPFLAKLSVDDFYQIFKETTGLDKHRVVKGAFMFRNLNEADESQQEITRKATEAMERIAAESPMNAKRAAMHGVKLD